MGVRDRIADVLRTALGPEFTVYAFPPDVADVPAIALKPGDPYQVPSSFGRDGAGVVAWNLDLEIVTHRADVESSLTNIEELRVAIAKALNGLDGSDPDGVSGARWSSLGGPGTDMIGEIPVLISTMQVFVKANGP